MDITHPRNRSHITLSKDRINRSPNQPEHKNMTANQPRTNDALTRVDSTSSFENTIRPPTTDSNNSQSTLRRTSPARGLDLRHRSSRDNNHPKPCRAEWRSSSGGHRPNLKPQQFDGSKPLREYLQHFKVVDSLNSWSEAEKGLYLTASLTGSAQRILNRVDVYAHGGYDQLLLALPGRYAPCHQEELYRATLKNCRQGKEESLRTLAEKVEIAVEKAYPYTNRATVEQLTTEYFLTAILNRRVRQWVHLRGPRNLRDAVALALQAEAYYKGEDLRMPQRTRMVTTGYGTDAPEWSQYEDHWFPADIEQIAAVSSHRRMPQIAESRETGQGMTEERVLELVKRALEDWKSQPRTDEDKWGIQCYSCREYGHFARECPGIRLSGNRNQENYQGLLQENRKEPRKEVP